MGTIIKHEAFDMSTPCIAIDHQCELMETTVSGLANHLKVSAAMSSPFVKQYIQLSLLIGSEKAMQHMLISLKDDHEEFCVLWSEARKDVADGAIPSTDDLVDAISTAKKKFLEHPWRIFIVQINARDYDIP